MTSNQGLRHVADEIACADPDKCNEVCGNRAGCTNIAYPLLVLRRMPTGIIQTDSGLTKGWGRVEGAQILSSRASCTRQLLGHGQKKSSL